MPAPTFLGIGAQKAGTTWLFRNVAEHPNVCSGEPKEIHYFDRPQNWKRGSAWYEAQFTRNLSGTAVGECTPAYLWTAGDAGLAERSRGGHLLGTAQRLADRYPDVRLIVCLRHPVDRAISSLNHEKKHGRMRPGAKIFEGATIEPGIIEKGYYGRHLAEWFDHFDREQVMTLIYEEDIKPDAAKPATLRRVFEHIGVDPEYESSLLYDRPNPSKPDFELRRRHATGPVRWILDRLPSGLHGLPIWDLPDGSSEAEALWGLYEPDVRHLERLLGRSVPWAGPSVKRSRPEVGSTPANL